MRTEHNFNGAADFLSLCLFENDQRELTFITFTVRSPDDDFTAHQSFFYRIKGSDYLTTLF